MYVFSRTFTSTFAYLRTLILVYRVHWLRARARSQRWAEEVTLTTNEMEWIPRFFISKSREWKKYIGDNTGLGDGHIAYAERQSAMWQDMGEQARMQFLKVRPAVQPPRNVV